MSSQINFFVVETSMTISSMNIKSGTNWILPCRIKPNITFDLQKQIIKFRRKMQYLNFDQFEIFPIEAAEINYKL